MVESGQWDEMNETFTAFYDEELKDIVTEIDMEELGGIDFVFKQNENETKQTRQNNNISKALISSLSIAWKKINNKEEKGKSEHDHNITNCNLEMKILTEEWF